MTGLVNFVLLNALVASGLAVLVWITAMTPAVRRRPGLRQILWGVVLLKFVTPPMMEIAILPGPRASAPQADVRADDAVLSESSTAPVVLRADAEAKMPTNVPVSPGVDWIVVLGVITATGSLAIVVLSVRQTWRLRKVLARGESGDARLHLLSRRAAKQMGLSAAPLVCVVSAKVSPLLWVGRSGPLIVLPRRLVACMTDEELRCVLSHEIAHYVRRDHWMNLVTFVVTALCWWNPVVWWVRRELRIAQEACCDAMVVNRSGATRRMYAETLFRALEFIQAEGSSAPALVSGFGDKSSTERRFEMIANPAVSHRLSWWSYPVLIAALAVLLCVPVQGDSNPDPTTSNQARRTELWKLVDPSGAEYYLEMKGFEGRFVEARWKHGGGVVFDNRDPQDVPQEERGYQATFGSVTGGPTGGFPQWIRAYRYDPAAKEFDGSWYTLSVDAETGTVTVREAIGADLAGEIRRKATGIPVLLPSDAKVWRLVIGHQHKRPSEERPNTGEQANKKADGVSLSQRDNAAASPRNDVFVARTGEVIRVRVGERVREGKVMARREDPRQDGVAVGDLDADGFLDVMVTGPGNHDSAKALGAAWLGGHNLQARNAWQAALKAWTGKLPATDDYWRATIRAGGQLFRISDLDATANDAANLQRENRRGDLELRIDDRVEQQLMIDLPKPGGGKLIKSAVDVWQRLYGDAPIEQIQMAYVDGKTRITISGPKTTRSSDKDENGEGEKSKTPADGAADGPADGASAAKALPR